MANQKKKGPELFWKVNLEKFTQYWYNEKPNRKKRAEGASEGPEMSELKQLNVLAYIFQNIHQKDNTIIMTYDKVAQKTGVSKDTVARIIGRLGEMDCIRKVQNGAYMVNPYTMMWGPESKRDKLYCQFTEAKKIRKFHKSKKATQEESKQKEVEPMQEESAQEEVMLEESMPEYPMPEDPMQEEDMPEEIILEEPMAD